jgi:trans-aconitate 2-methyltransferase
MGTERAPKNYSTAEEAERRLRAAGFTDVRTWLTAAPTPLRPGEEIETYLRTIILRVELQRIPARERDTLVRAVAERLPEPVIDYVRLNILARRAGKG